MEDEAIPHGPLESPRPFPRRPLGLEGKAEAFAEAFSIDAAGEVGPTAPSPIVLYEFGPDTVTLTARGPAGGAGDRTLQRTLPRDRTGVAPAQNGPSARPSCRLPLASSGGAQLLDLAAAGVSAVAGSETAVDETIEWFARAAAALVGASLERLIVVGRELRLLAEESDAVPVSRVEESLEVLRRLESTGRAGDGSRATLIVVSRDAFRGAAVAALLAYARRRPWLCVLLPSVVAAVRVLIATVGGEQVVCVRATGLASDGDSFFDGLEGAGFSLDPPVEVAVLGQIEVRGASGSLERRPKLTELIVYLAMHPEGASSTTWQSALWPDRRVPAQTVANRLSEARRLLGMQLDGHPRLRRNVERHRLAGVVTDWERFRVLADRNREPDAWRAAMELVRGRPFDDLQQGHWTVFEGFQGEIEQAITDCALRYGEERLAAGDPDAATWAGQRAIRACPYDERLHRLLMRAADAVGNRAGVEAVFRNLVVILEIEGDTLGGVHPETAALYERLVGRRAVAS